MSHAITITDILIWIGIPVGLLLLAAIAFGILALFSPFRSGH
jgi:hypothetical protein